MEVSVNDLKPNHARPDAAPIANHARLSNTPWPVTLIYNTSITQSNAFATCAYVVAIAMGTLQRMNQSITAAEVPHP